MSQSNKAMETLTAQWYNAMVAGLGLDPQKFQLYQGPNSLVSTSQSMWNMFNAVPPKAVNSFYLDPAQANNFAPNYNVVLSALRATSTSDFQTCMGDYYSKWQTYFNEHDPETWDPQGITNMFNKWALKNAPGKAGCVNALNKIFIDPINMAQAMFSAAKGSYAWNQTIDGLNKALSSGAKKTFTLDSKTGSSDLSHTWGGGTTSIFFDIFSFGGGASYDKLSESATSQGLNISAEFQKVTTFAAGPYAQKDSNDPILSEYEPWYYSAALSRAYKTKDNTVWDPQSPTTWESMFGSNGIFQRMSSALVVADGVKITMTSSASYSTSEQEEIRGAAKAGIWPFFTISGQGGSTTKVTFDDFGKFTATTEIALGNPQVLGILQSPFSSVFG